MPVKLGFSSKMSCLCLYLVVLSMFMSSTCSISGFKFNFLIYFELIFVQDEGYGSNFHCQVSYSISFFPPVFEIFLGRGFTFLIRFISEYIYKLLWMRFFCYLFEQVYYWYIERLPIFVLILYNATLWKDLKVFW